MYEYKALCVCLKHLTHRQKITSCRTFVLGFEILKLMFKKWGGRAQTGLVEDRDKQ
jgi:hypothetical protein